MKKVLFAVAGLLLGISSSFGQLSRDLDSFKELEVTDKIRVDLVASDHNKIMIEGELANQMELIQVNNSLRLKMTGSYLLQGDKVQVTLYATDVDRIIARKGAVVSNNKAKLKAESIYLSANEGAQIESDIETNNLDVSITSGGKIHVAGNTSKQDVDVTAGGMYHGKDLVSAVAVVRVNAGGKSEVTVKENVDAQVRAGGVIDIFGKPKYRKDKKLLGGRINYK